MYHTLSIQSRVKRALSIASWLIIMYKVDTVDRYNIKMHLDVELRNCSEYFA